MDNPLSDGPPKGISDICVETLPGCKEVSCLSCTYDMEAISIPEFEEIGIIVPPSLAKAVSKRKAEFLAGRYLGKIILERLASKATGDAPPDTLIGLGDSRQPIWPKGYLGSISHTSGKAICAITSSGSYDGLGIDLERYVVEPVLSEIQDRIIGLDELRLVEHSELSREQGFTLAFSAKEAIFKALFPLVGSYFDFTDAEVSSIDPSAGRFKAVLLKTLSPVFPEGTEITGGFELRQNEVLTCVAL